MIEFRRILLLDGEMKPLLILTPLLLECDALSPVIFAGRESSEKPFGRVDVRMSSDGLTALAVGGHGKVQFALTAAHLIRELAPRAVLAFGAAVSFTPDLKPRDLIVATETVEHDFTLRFLPKPQPRFAADETLLAACKGAPPPNTGYRVHFGPVASGDEDVIEEARAHDLNQKTGAWAVAWEGAGGARACRFHTTRYLEIRAITDSANAQSLSDFKANIKLGMENAGHLIRAAQSAMT
jgi:adenosylhomocysteine nucleosidase